MIVDELRVANWLRSKDGAKGRNRPKRISPLAKKPGTRIGRTTRSPREVMDLLRRIGPRSRRHEHEEVTTDGD